MAVTLLKGSETHRFERIHKAAECVECCHTQKEISSFTKGRITVAFVMFELFKLQVQ